jgi:hypothetical protein
MEKNGIRAYHSTASLMIYIQKKLRRKSKKDAS